MREDFYTKLNDLLRTHKSKHTTIVAGDFNTKTSSSRDDKVYHNIIGGYGKGQTNENGKHLLQFAKMSNLRLTITFFNHKSSHRTTWESPATPTNNRKNKYRNQIDYILVKEHKGIQYTNSRSHGGMQTPSDHPSKKKPTTINIANLRNDFM